jgi:hypothetical protein
MTRPVDAPVIDRERYGADSGRNDISIVAVRDPDSPLLTRIHRELITPHFSDDNDVDSPGSMRNYLRTAGLRAPHCVSYNVIAALDARDRVLGATIFGVFSRNGIAFVKGEYTVIAAGARKHGTLERLLSARYRSAFNDCISAGIGDLAFIVIQVCSADTGVRERRIRRMWRLHGFRCLDFPFTQLPLRDDLDAITSFDLFLQPLSETYRKRSYLTAEEMLAVVDACCTFRESEKPFTVFKEYQRMRLYIDGKKRIPLCR